MCRVQHDCLHRSTTCVIGSGKGKGESGKKKAGVGKRVSCPSPIGEGAGFVVRQIAVPAASLNVKSSKANPPSTAAQLLRFDYRGCEHLAGVVGRVGPGVDADAGNRGFMASSRGPGGTATVFRSRVLGPLGSGDQAGIGMTRRTCTHLAGVAGSDARAACPGQR